MKSVTFFAQKILHLVKDEGSSLYLISSQCLDRAQFCCFSCRIDSEENTYRTGEQRRCQHDCRADSRRDCHSHTAAHNCTDSISCEYTEQDSDQPSDDCQDRCFCKKLQHNRSSLGSKRFTDSDLPRSLCDRYKHDIHNSDSSY